MSTQKEEFERELNEISRQELNGEISSKEAVERLVLLTAEILNCLDTRDPSDCPIYPCDACHQKGKCYYTRKE